MPSWIDPRSAHHDANPLPTTGRQDRGPSHGEQGVGWGIVKLDRSKIPELTQHGTHHRLDKVSGNWFKVESTTF